MMPTYQEMEDVEIISQLMHDDYSFELNFLESKESASPKSKRDRVEAIQKLK